MPFCDKKYYKKTLYTTDIIEYNKTNIGKEVVTMTDKNSATRKFQVPTDDKEQMRQVLREVFDALDEKGYNPINQIVGYIMSGDPTYITSYNNARALLAKLERDEIMEELLRSYLAEQ